MKAQISPHRPHLLHCSSSTIGIGTVTWAEPSSTGLRNRWALGSSTSQSIKQTDSVSARVRAKFIAMVVLPVPPFPLAIDIIMRHPHLKLFNLRLSTYLTVCYLDGITPSWLYSYVIHGHCHDHHGVHNYGLRYARLFRVHKGFPHLLRCRQQMT